VKQAVAVSLKTSAETACRWNERSRGSPVSIPDNTLEVREWEAVLQKHEALKLVLMLNSSILSETSPAYTACAKS
jgi:hypothetical protein